jgi:uncharacterized protein (TIGR03790 family)
VNVIFIDCFSQIVTTLPESYCEVTSQPATNANIADKSQVLVVYSSEASSTSLANYYKIKRDIPSNNMLCLTLPTSVNYGTGTVSIVNENEMLIRNGECSNWGNNMLCDTLALHYLRTQIVNPIISALNTRTDINSGEILRDHIRYIVVIKGIPFQIKYGDDAWHDVTWNLSIDLILSLLPINNNGNNDLSWYHNQNFLDQLSEFANPYFGQDELINYNHRFLPNHYSTDQLTLSYLVSRLDGQDTTAVKQMIDRLANPDKTGKGVWVLDGHPHNSLALLNLGIFSTVKKLSDLGYQTLSNLTSEYITSSQLPIMGYSSLGRHADMPSNYVTNTLSFSYLNGSVVNTYESFNYCSNNPTRRKDGQGMISEFTKKRNNVSFGRVSTGTSGGVGHCFEPYEISVIKNSMYFPMYAAGYSMVDAAYLGMPYLRWQNVVIGDPLTTIAHGKQIITSDTLFSDTLLILGLQTIPNGKQLNISPNSVLIFKHQGFIENNGKLSIGINTNLLTDNWQKSLLLDNSGSHPTLVWANHPSFINGIGYKIYRKYGNMTWDLIANTTQQRYTDSTIIINQGMISGTTVNYRVTKYKTGVESDNSNTASVTTVGQEIGKSSYSNSDEKITDYHLYQNYPNPFNPVTIISFDIPESGLVKLSILDILGKEISVLREGIVVPGHHSVTFDASELSSGLYFYKLTFGNNLLIKKMILVK